MKKTAHLYAQLLDKVSPYMSEIKKSTCKTLCAIICGLMLKRTTNLNLLKDSFGLILGKTEVRACSHYKRLTRFFQDAVNTRQLSKTIMVGSGKLLLTRLKAKNQPVKLLMDGTSWEFGKTVYHFLVLSVLHEGISIPLFFINLRKKGCSNFQERKRFFQQANKLYNLAGMTLMADREYVGREWFAFLEKEMKMFYVIRLSKTDYKKEIEASGKVYSKLFRPTQKGEIRSCKVEIQGCQVRILVRENPHPEKESEQWVILISNHFDKSNKRLYQFYRFRWQIECMFKHLKSNGFNMEDIGLTQNRKVKLMISIVMATYILCVAEGLQFLNKRQMKKNKVTNEMYPALSIFKHGVEFFNKHTNSLPDLLKHLSSLFEKHQKLIRKHPKIQNVQ